MDLTSHHANIYSHNVYLIVGDCDLVCLASGLVGSRNVKDTIGVNVESNFNLWSSTRCWWDSFKIELSKQVIILCHLTFTFKDLNEHTWLVVCVCGEGLLLFGWDSSVSWNERCHNLASSLNTLRKRSNIKKK